MTRGVRGPCAVPSGLTPGGTWSWKQPQSSQVMNSTVDRHSGPFITADATWPSQSSPAVMENPLCSLNAASCPPGVTIAKLGRLPDRASFTNAELGTLFAFLRRYRHSANEGQISHP